MINRFIQAKIKEKYSARKTRLEELKKGALPTKKLPQTMKNSPLTKHSNY
jgi:hypothetical protein